MKKAGKSKYRPFAFGLVLLFATLALFVLAGEVVLRVKGDFYTYSEKNGGPYASPYWEGRGWFNIHKKNKPLKMSCPEYTFEDATNSEGLRDKEHPRRKPPGEFRVACLGDSYTEGLGAPFSKTWPQVLKRLLETGRPGCKIRVIQAGSAGSDPFFSYMLLRERLLAYRPDLVILAMNTSDVSDVMSRGGMERFRPDGTVRCPSPLATEWLFARSHLYRFYLLQIKGLDWLFLDENARAEKAAGAKALLGLCAGMFQDLGQKNGFRFVVVAHPVPYEWSTGTYLEGFSLLIRQMRARGIPMLDLLDFFVSRHGKGDKAAAGYFWLQDHHHNEAGYAEFAQGVAGGMQNLGLLPRGCGAPGMAQAP